MIDLLRNRVDAEIGVAFFVACISVLKKAPVNAAMLVLGVLLLLTPWRWLDAVAYAAYAVAVFALRDKRRSLLVASSCMGLIVWLPRELTLPLNRR